MVQHDKYYTSYKEEFELNIIGIYVQVSKLRRMFTIQRDKYLNLARKIVDIAEMGVYKGLAAHYLKIIFNQTG
jgi:hypothetical protein